MDHGGPGWHRVKKIKDHHEEHEVRMIKAKK
jgi:hypothetical protein